MNKRLVTGLILLFSLAACDSKGPNPGGQWPQSALGNAQGDAAQGADLFVQYCATCHGSDARGSQQGPLLVHRVYRPAHHADYAFHLAVRNGVPSHHWRFGAMPAQPDVTPEEVEHIIAYVRGEQQRAGIR